MLSPLRTQIAGPFVRRYSGQSGCTVQLHAGGALAVRPGGRQLRRDQAEVDAVRVRAAVAERPYDLPLVVLACPVDRAATLRRERRIVVQIHAADALRRRVAVVAAVRSRIARVAVL